MNRWRKACLTLHGVEMETNLWGNEDGFYWIPGWHAWDRREAIEAVEDVTGISFDFTTARARQRWGRLVDFEGFTLGGIDACEPDADDAFPVWEVEGYGW